MDQRAKIVFFIFILFFSVMLTSYLPSLALASNLPANPQSDANCVHGNMGPTWSDGAHPHAYYRNCQSCGQKVYTGGYATKAHGNGAYGSGTCPSCGSHTIVGRNCTSGGSCACGLTPVPLGHNYGETYSEGAHPHRYYRTCQRCSYVDYPGGCATKNHGNGVWGSGTCPSCGEHTYAMDWDLTLERFSEHPHAWYYSCVCGSNYVDRYVISEECSICTAGRQTVDVIKTANITYTYLDGDSGSGTMVSFTAPLHMEYTEMYKKDGEKFISFSSRNYCELDKDKIPVWAEVTLIANAQVYYKDAADSLLHTSELARVSFEAHNEKTKGLFTFSGNPVYSTTGATTTCAGELFPHLIDMTILYT